MIDSRIIATTNRDPQRLIQEEKFRDDLYYRLNVIQIECAPLRGRRDAIMALTSEFLHQASVRQEKPDVVISDSAMEALVNYSWPGNVRELQNAVERAVLLTDSNAIGLECFECLTRSRYLKNEATGESLAVLEEKHILEILDGTGGNRTRAAEKLGISVRTLRNKLKEYSCG